MTNIRDQAVQIVRDYCGCSIASPDLNGIINQPGRFEGEPVYVLLYYWDTVVMNGCGDDSTDCDCEDSCDCPVVSTIDLDATDWEAFPAVNGHKTLRLWESDQGFVYHSLE